MEKGPESLLVSTNRALIFFFERLQGVSRSSGNIGLPSSQLLYNASILADFATTSTESVKSLPSPKSLQKVFDVFVLDQSKHTDPEIMELAGAQCLFLTGFFGNQQMCRHNVGWYVSLGAGFYGSAGKFYRYHQNEKRAEMMMTMSERFDLWRKIYARLAVELRDERFLFRPPS